MHWLRRQPSMKEKQLRAEHSQHPCSTTNELDSIEEERHLIHRSTGASSPCNLHSFTQAQSDLQSTSRFAACFRIIGEYVLPFVFPLTGIGWQASSSSHTTNTQQNHPLIRPYKQNEGCPLRSLHPAPGLLCHCCLSSLHPNQQYVVTLLRCCSRWKKTATIFSFSTTSVAIVHKLNFFICVCVCILFIQFEIKF